MSLYLFIYTLSILFSIYGGFLVYKIYKNSFWLFFLLFTIFMSMWFLLFFLFFSGIQDENILLTLSRVCFWVWILTTYSLLFGVYFFNRGKYILEKKVYMLIFWFFFFILVLYSFTDIIILWLEYSEHEWVYREVPGIGYIFHVFLQSLFLLWFLFIGFLKVKHQNYINKLRLKYISFFSYGLVFLLIILQLFLPLLWIWIFEKELILIFVFFIFWVVYIIKRYYFTNIYYSLTKVFIKTVSLMLSVWWVAWLHYIYGNINNWFWWYSWDFWYENIAIGIIFYIFLQKYIDVKILWKYQKNQLQNEIKKLEQNISTITDFETLQMYLKTELKKIFHIHYCEIHIYDEKEDNPLKIYFEKSDRIKFFIHDIVFIEENKHKFEKTTICNYLKKEDVLLFPIFHQSWKNIWYISFWSKLFGDFYDRDEIKIIQNFIFFLEYHLKYIQSFEKIQDLSINLDKKIDEKTMEYNHLINKQKEYISLISHEIRSPMASAIFQADSILDDLKAGEKNMKYLQSEVKMLNTILLKIWDLVNKLFSVQYYDTHEVTLYKQKIDVVNLIIDEIEVQKHIHKNITFVNNVDRSIEFLEIDKVQFLQVIQNLLSNSIKFLTQKQKIIEITAKVEKNIFILSIADNGSGFWWVDVSELFAKYTMGKTTSLWLWLWLYLCKKIIEMHSGTISAGISQKLKGAEFIIKIPLPQE